MSDVVATLADLIDIPSAPGDDKDPILRHSRDALEGAGMEVEIEAGTLVASHGEGGGILSGHLDTVPLGNGWSREQGEIAEGRMYGRGTNDMKGGVAAILAAAADLVGEGLSFSVYLTTDEEVGMAGARMLAGRRGTAEAGGILVCEPTDLNVAYAEKGVFRFRLVTEGTSGHSSTPWLGENAIMGMARIVSRLADLSPREPSEGLTMSVNTIEGGVKDNVIPDRCVADVDARYPPSMGREDVLRTLEERLAGCDRRMEVIKDVAPFSGDALDPLNQALLRFLGTDAVILPYATEASIYGKVNARTHVCGPGRMDVLHTIDEFVDIHQLRTMVGVVRLFVERTQG